MLKHKKNKSQTMWYLRFDSIKFPWNFPKKIPEIESEITFMSGYLGYPLNSPLKSTDKHSLFYSVFIMCRRKIEYSDLIHLLFNDKDVGYYDNKLEKQKYFELINDDKKLLGPWELGKTPSLFYTSAVHYNNYVPIENKDQQNLAKSEYQKKIIKNKIKNKIKKKIKTNNNTEIIKNEKENTQNEIKIESIKNENKPENIKNDENTEGDIEDEKEIKKEIIKKRSLKRRITDHPIPEIIQNNNNLEIQKIQEDLANLSCRLDTQDLILDSLQVMFESQKVILIALETRFRSLEVIIKKDLVIVDDIIRD